LESIQQNSPDVETNRIRIGNEFQHAQRLDRFDSIRQVGIVCVDFGTLQKALAEEIDLPGNMANSIEYPGPAPLVVGHRPV
jgi:hypothetical protein